MNFYNLFRPFTLYLGSDLNRFLLLAVVPVFVLVSLFFIIREVIYFVD